MAKPGVRMRAVPSTGGNGSPEPEPRSTGGNGRSEPMEREPNGDNGNGVSNGNGDGDSGGGNGDGMPPHLRERAEEDAAPRAAPVGDRDDQDDEGDGDELAHYDAEGQAAALRVAAQTDELRESAARDPEPEPPAAEPMDAPSPDAQPEPAGPSLMDAVAAPAEPARLPTLLDGDRLAPVPSESARTAARAGESDGMGERGGAGVLGEGAAAPPNALDGVLQEASPSVTEADRRLVAESFAASRNRRRRGAPPRPPSSRSVPAPTAPQPEAGVDADLLRRLGERAAERPPAPRKRQGAQPRAPRRPPLRHSPNAPAPRLRIVDR